MKRFFALFTLFGFLSLSCAEVKSPVTDTGNPNISSGTYINKALRFFINYPDSWSVEEKILNTTSVEVVFASGHEVERTSVIILGSLLDEAPSSLEAHLQQTFPQRTFVAIGFKEISGFLFDDPEATVNGADRKIYYFSKDRGLLELTADLFPSGIAELEQLLNGMTFF